MTSMDSRFNEIHRQMQESCISVGRDPETVSLIAVSKTRPVEVIDAATKVDWVHFGENYAQELRDKSRYFETSTPEILWHYIGRLQKNKAKYVAPNAYRIHTLEHIDQVRALVKRAPNGIDGLIAVNVGREAQKSGVDPKDLWSIAEALATVPECRIHGLMCIPPAADNPEDTAPFFEEMQHLLHAGQNAGYAWTELSMGMSADFKVAIRYGATWIRVGTALFGPRA